MKKFTKPTYDKQTERLVSENEEGFYADVNGDVIGSFGKFSVIPIDAVWLGNQPLPLTEVEILEQKIADKKAELDALEGAQISARGLRETLQEMIPVVTVILETLTTEQKLLVTQAKKQLAVQNITYKRLVDANTAASVKRDELKALK